MTDVRARTRRSTPGRGSTLLIPLDHASPEPLHRQVYRGMREAILGGRLPAGAQIPSSRWLADYLGVSRTTVLGAFDQLVAEGFIVGVVGSGSYVAQPFPDRLLQVRRNALKSDVRVARPARLADRIVRLGEELKGPRHLAGPVSVFRIGLPPVDAFPLSVWNRLAGARHRKLETNQLRHGPPRGTEALRQAIVTHHAVARGVRCSPDQVVVLASAQEAMDLACRVVLNPGEAVWFEEPGYSGARAALIAAGAHIVPVPLDAEGLVVERGIATAPDARLVYVTPSHQFPTGVTLSLERRLALLDWAARSDAWILEDDYDSEYRYAGCPLTALQGLDVSGRVLYIGTFNKTVFPALRLAYLVLPEALVDPALALRRRGAQHAPTIEQLILTDFLEGGHYVRHIRAMRALCRERRDALIAAMESEATGLLSISRPDTGLHAVAWLPPGVDDQEASRVAIEHGVEAVALSCYCATLPERGGLVLGYGGIPTPDIQGGVRTLVKALRTLI